MLSQFALFDSHFHIIDPRFPLVTNQGYLPAEFTCAEYLTRMADYRLLGGAVVSGSFQACDQDYLLAALATLGPAFVGVTQLPHTAADAEILRLDARGIRAIRFNLKRGGSATLDHLSSMAARVHELAGWHVELYIDSSELEDIFTTLTGLPSVSIDHLGLSNSGYKTLLKLAEKGVRIKATGFGRIDFDVKNAIRELFSANPSALMFGTDLPSTRAPVVYQDADFALIAEVLGADSAQRVLSENALDFYRIQDARSHNSDDRST